MKAMRLTLLAASTVLAALTGTGAIPVIDLTAAARAQGMNAWEATASACSEGYGATNLFDGVEYVISSRWTSGDKDLNHWVRYRFTDEFESNKFIRVTSYKFGAGNGWYGGGAGNTALARMPASWTFEGSDDGETWATLDTQNISSNDYAHTSSWWLYKSFQVASPACYRYYRFNFTARCGGELSYSKPSYQLGEINLNGQVLVVPDEEDRMLSWVGGTSGDWHVAANWRNEKNGTSRIPADGDIVSIPADTQTKVTLSQPTADLLSLTVGSGSGVVTLEMTNWTTCVSATNLTIVNKGVITCAGGGTNVETVSRVWLKGRDITIAAGGKIDVDKLGYAALPKSIGNYAGGCGPAAGFADHGAAHGGYGGRSAFCSMSSVTSALMPVDDDAEPSQPGSSGGRSKWATGHAGGGAVRIEASGRVTVDGSILASGGNVDGYTTNPGASNFNTGHDSAGAGGSVWISCQTFAGSGGVLKAVGGHGDVARNKSPTSQISVPGCAAGGGRIAIHYDTALQSDGLVKDMTFDVSSGFYGWSEYYKTNYQFRVRDRDAGNRMSADMGTLWFSDAKMLESLGRGISGQICNMPASLTLDSLEITNGWFRFARDGFTLNVTGDLTIAGSNSCYEVGGVIPTNRTAFAELYSTAAAKLNVGGDLVLKDGGRLDVHAADTNLSGTAFGAYVKVDGKMSVTNTAAVYAWCDPVGGGVPRFDVGSLDVAVGGLVSAEWRGYAGGHQYDTFSPKRSSGYGPGAGMFFTHTYLERLVDSKSCLFSYVSVGGGHGGQGGWKDAAAGTSNPDYHKVGLPYDDPHLPMAPGSGGAGSSWTLCGGAGGGVICIVSTGAISIDGELNADGGGCLASRSSSGAGGSIYLEGETVRLGEGSVLTASAIYGGVGSTTAVTNPDHTYYYWQVEGSGAGGRIAIRTGLHDEPGKRIKLIKSQERPVSFLGQIRALGGVNPVGNLITDWNEDINGENGTIWYVNAIAAPGMVIMVR